MKKYVFPGVWPFIESAARSSGRDLHQAGRCRQLWHVTQVQDALGQIPRMGRAGQTDSLQHAIATRESLALALEGVDAAIREVAAAVDLPIPSHLTEPKPSKKKPL